jgi:hypothetical protein
VSAFAALEDMKASKEDAAADVAAAEVAGAPLVALATSMLPRAINLMRLQQASARPIRRNEKAAGSSSKSSKNYELAMEKFKTAARSELADMFPKSTAKQLDSAVRAAWLDSEERKEAIEAMSHSEKKKRRFVK